MADDGKALPAKTKVGLLPNETWLIVWEQYIAADGTFPLGAVLELEFLNPNPKFQRFVPLFTSEQRATRFIWNRGQPKDKLKPIACPNLGFLEKLFQGLGLKGIHWVAYNPGVVDVDAKPIVDFLKVLQQDHGQA